MTRLHDGYTLRDKGHIVFYTDCELYKAIYGGNFKVDQDKVSYFEALCETYRRDFMAMGQLRLHTPVEPHQEELGTQFLFVPTQHRARIF